MHVHQTLGTGTPSWDLRAVLEDVTATSGCSSSCAYTEVQELEKAI